MENLFVYLKNPPVCDSSVDEFDQAACDGLSTLKEAQEAGGVTWNYGRFLETLIDFLLIALILYFVVRSYTKAFLLIKKKEEEEEPTTRDCPFCLSECKIKAVKCSQCASVLPADEPKLSEIMVKSD